MATQFTVIGYRFHISYYRDASPRRCMNSSPYPGYSTREECEQAAIRCKRYVEDSLGARCVTLSFDVEMKRESAQ